MVISGAGTARQTVTAASWLTPKSYQVFDYIGVDLKVSQVSSGQKSRISFQVVREESCRTGEDLAKSEILYQ